MKIDKSQLLKYVLSVLVAGILLYFSFRGLKWSDFIEAVRSCRPGWLLVAMLAGVASFFIRALRWRRIVLPVDGSVKVHDTFNAVNISYLFNLALPRVGELARCGYLARHCRSAGYDKLLGTVVLERLWDVLMMFIFVLVLVFTFIVFMLTPAWKVVGSKKLAIGIAMCQMIGYPGTELIATEISNAVAQTEEERDAVTARIQTAYVISGFT